MPPSREEIADFVTSVLANFLEGEFDEGIDWAAPIGADGLGVESIGILEVVVNVEQEYDLSIPDEVIERMASGTFGALVDEVAALHPATAEAKGA
ncbi:phosphopantetheine-binding protein [Saccharothrix sp. Mg75]|uniref:phosphopantetheine-binding protein n=1 Tax=Saccharothrix sp. Mg75 TaxID=3445357 RepID=UPI003EEDD31A